MCVALGFFPAAGGDDDGMLRLVELPHQLNGIGHRFHPAALVGMDQGAVQVEAETHGAGDLRGVTSVTGDEKPMGKTWRNLQDTNG